MGHKQVWKLKKKQPVDKDRYIYVHVCVSRSSNSTYFYLLFLVYFVSKKEEDGAPGSFRQ